MNRRGQRRRLPPTPNKPSTLQTRPTNINFPKLNTSPTYVSISVIQFHYKKISIEELRIEKVEVTPGHIIRSFILSP